MIIFSNVKKVLKEAYEISVAGGSEKAKGLHKKRNKLFGTLIHLSTFTYSLCSP